MAKQEDHPNLAAIDIGSNGIRLIIASTVGERQIVPLKTYRAGIRLGADVFTIGHISNRTAKRVIKVFQKFRKLLRKYHVTNYRAVATSALRESKNKNRFLRILHQTTGIRPQIVQAKEEARLIFEAVSNHVDLRNEQAVLIDIGGGSVELTFIVDGVMKYVRSMPLGTVRLLAKTKNVEHYVNACLRQQDVALKAIFRKFIRRSRPLICIGTGGNMEALLRLRQTLLKKEPSKILALSELEIIISQLSRMSFRKRVELLKLRPDRADVIMPAAISLRALMIRLRTKRILVPCVGLKEGLLLDIARERSQLLNPGRKIFWSLYF